MRHSLQLGLLAATLSVAACTATLESERPQANTQSPPHAVFEAGATIPLVRLRSGPYAYTPISGLADSLRLVVRDSLTWRRIWSNIHQNTSPPPELPAADFTQHMFIVAALGNRPTGGYTIYIDSAYARTDFLEVVVRKLSPGEKCFVGQALTQPVDVARLPRIDKPVHFREHAIVNPCE